MFYNGVNQQLNPSGWVREKVQRGGGGWQFPMYAGLHGFDLTTSARCFRGFHGARGPAYMGLPATTWVPMGARVPILSRNDHPIP